MSNIGLYQVFINHINLRVKIMDTLSNFFSNDYHIINLLFYLGLAATGVYLIADAIITGRPFQRTIAGGFIWAFQLLFGLSLTFFPFFHLLIPFILKN